MLNNGLILKGGKSSPLKSHYLGKRGLNDRAGIFESCSSVMVLRKVSRSRCLEQRLSPREWENENSEVGWKQIDLEQAG